MRTIYSLIWYLILPLVLIRLVVNSFKNPRYLERFWQRFGFVDKQNKNELFIWIHAVSVGEALATKPLIQSIQKEYPDYQIIITTGTPTGAETVAKLYGDNVKHFYQPYDFPFAIKLFLNRIQPNLCLVIETELWPNLFHFCSQKTIPIVLVNGRLSQRSANRYLQFRKLTVEMLNNINLIAAQTEADAERFKTLGSAKAKISITGSIKFDMVINQNAIAESRKLKQSLFVNRWIWVAASTHPGEDEIVLRAHLQLLKELPDCLLILAPRHPHRCDTVAQISQRMGLNISRRTDEELDLKQVQVYLLDTLGELLVFYGVSDIALVCGTLLEIGGHNPLEPASQSKPILIGKHDFNFKEIGEKLIAAQAAIRVENENEIVDQLVRLFQDKEVANKLGINARKFIEQNRGSTEKLLKELQPYLVR